MEHIGENLRYRFLGLRLYINDVRKYFDYPKQLSNPENNNYYILTDSGKDEEER